MITGEELFPNHHGDHLLDWFQDSILDDDPYNDQINGYQWWDSPPIQSQQSIATTASPTTLPSPEQPKKRKPTSNPTLQTQRRRNSCNGNSESNNPEEERQRRGSSTKKPPAKNCGNGTSGGTTGKDARWAEQLLYPCASAIWVQDLDRVQHYLWVLHELASVAGDANHRLAAHGMGALVSRISPAVAIPAGLTADLGETPTFATSDPKLFHDSLIRFHEISPWLSFTNAVANASILQTLASEPYKTRQNIHVVDIGVSHGVQWPTLLEALTRRPGGAPATVRLTIVPTSFPPIKAAEVPVPFSSGPPGDDFPSRLLRFAKRIDLNLKIDQTLKTPQSLKTLVPEICGSRKEDETVVVCAQFRLHQLDHHVAADCNEADERSEFLRRVRESGPDIFVLSDYEGACSCSRCSDYPTGFARRVEFLWRFLDSTSAAFKGRECEERRVLEGEAASVLSGAGEMKEGSVQWADRMTRAGFAAEGFGEEATDSGRALLRKHDGNWEMKAGNGPGPISLYWKGQPVSFCSLWKLPGPTS